MIPLKDSYDRLLLIDDEPGIRRMMALDLGADGYEVLTAADGAEGLGLFEVKRPDIVLTDVKMPGLDGLEVLRRIKAASPETEVIVITGHGDMDTAIRSLQLEAADFITKPISDEALAVALKRAKERLRLKAELAAYTTDLEARVAEAAGRLLTAERLAAVGRTVASVAHSVKNMLGGLRGGAYLVEQGLAKPDLETAAQGLAMVKRNLGRVKDFVRDLLTLAKPRVPEKSPCDAAGLAQEAVEALIPEAEAKGVELTLAAAPQGLTVEAERPALLDALLNLISNALDATAHVLAGRVEVAVRAGQGEVVVEVRDNGPGLDEEAQAHLFQGFYSTKGAGGTGLGLMVAHKTLAEHGGRVEHENRPQGGAAFRLVLPRRVKP
jgi:signal transduction histidine kinase